MRPIVWSVSELAEMTKERVHNRYDSNIAVTGLTGKGKCQPKGSKILMADGEWKNIEDIKFGDLVLSPQKDGSIVFAKVTKTSKWFCNETYDITQKNRAKKKLYSCSNNHTIPYLYRKNTRVNGIRDYKYFKWIYKETTAEEFSKFSKNTLGHQKVGFSSFKINKFKGRKNCNVEPYSLGVWLGDGHFSCKKNKKGYIARQLGITSNDFEIIEEVSKFYPIMSMAKKKNTPAKTYRFSLNERFSKLLTKYNLNGKNSGTKFIPKDALLSDYDYRIKLLAGLIDTDGYYSSGGYHFTLKSKQLIKDIHNLVYSLGGRTGEIKEVIKRIKSSGFVGKYYHISFYLGDVKIPLKLKRKIKNIKSFYISPNRIAIDVKKSKPQMVYGFSIKSSSRWYITDNWMITHNSTFLHKFFHKFPDFKLNEKFTMKRERMIELIRKHKLSYCWNDELISSASKRTFFDTEQNELIQTLTKYRNHFNIVGGAVPFFFTLDKELIKLFGMHINITARGIGVIHLPREEGRMYNEDLWDVKINQKLEEEWSKKIVKNPAFKIPHHKYTTFAGYVFFGKMTDKQEEHHEALKRKERGDDDVEDESQPEENFYQKVLRLLKEKKLDEKDLLNLCLFQDKKLSNVRVRLNQMLKDEGEGKTLKDFLLIKKKERDTNVLHNNNTPLKEINIDL